MNTRKPNDPPRHPRRNAGRCHRTAKGTPNANTAETAKTDARTEISGMIKSAFYALAVVNAGIAAYCFTEAFGWLS